MGRIQDHAPEVKQASVMQHFSHPHPLVEELFNLQNLPQGHVKMLCSGCKLTASGTIYVCRPCKTCAKLPQLIIYPSHPTHTLTLLPVALYSGSIFSCDACNQQGNGFSFHCQTCDFDLHVNCAIKPFSMKHQLHQCQLELTFTNPYGNKGFVCDVCSKRGSKQWLYRCKTCSFDVHLDCSNATGARVTIQPQPMVQQGSASMGVSLQNQILSQQPLAAGQVAYVIPNQVMHNATTTGNQQLQNGNQLMIDARTGALMANHQLTTDYQIMLAGPGHMQNYQPITSSQLMQEILGQTPNLQPTTGNQVMQGGPGQISNYQPTTGGQFMQVLPGQMPNFPPTTGNQLMQSNTGQMPSFQPTTGNQLMQGSPVIMSNSQIPVGTQMTQSTTLGSMPSNQPPTQGNYQQPMVPDNQASMTNNLVSAAMQGIFEGAAQTIGQTLVLSMSGDGVGGNVDVGSGDASEIQN